MSTTLQTAITNIRSAVDEAVSRFYSDNELAVWVNDAIRDIARRAEVIQSFNTAVSVTPGTGKYNLPNDVIRVHRMTFIPTGSTQEYPIQHSTLQEAQRLWGISPNQQSSYPILFCIWGTPGLGVAADATLTVQLFPVPAQAGTLNIYYYRIPYQFLPPLQNAAEYNKTLEIPEGWQDAVVDYAEYRAKRKQRDQTWQEAKELYDEKLEAMINITRQWHDQQRTFMTSTGINQPQWLIDPDYGEW